MQLFSFARGRLGSDSVSETRQSPGAVGSGLDNNNIITQPHGTQFYTRGVEGVSPHRVGG